MDDKHQFGTGFTAHKNLLSYVKEFNPTSERVCNVQLNTKLINIFIINVHAPTENKDETDKDEFYEKVARIYNETPGNTIKIIVEDFTAKVEKKTSFRPTIRMPSTHEISNNKGQRLVNFAISRKMIIGSTTFPHKNIHKYT